MMEPTLDECAQLLAEVAEIHRVLVDPQVAPAPSSAAVAELEASRQQSGKSGPWGEEQVRTAYTVAVTNYSAALEHAQTIVTLMSGQFTAVPASVLVRSLVEVASQAWWLLEPGIGHVNRVRRVLALRYRSATEGEKAAQADAIPLDEYHLYTETKAQVEEHAQELGLELPGVDNSKPWRVYFCGSERLPTHGYRVRQMLKDIDVPSVYNIFSGYTHGELFTLWREFELAAIGTQQLGRNPMINEQSFRNAMGIASYALHPPAYRLITMYGFDTDSARLEP